MVFSPTIGSVILALYDTDNSMAKVSTYLPKASTETPSGGGGGGGGGRDPEVPSRGGGGGREP